MHTTPSTLSPELERLARRRAGAKLGFVIHVVVYTLVVAGLGVLALSQGKAWTIWPAAGWGIGLLMHGLGVFGRHPGSALRERLIERERQALRAQG
jgi:uncharacterized membrane protein